VIATAFEPDPSAEDRSLAPPIGRPIANTQVYVLDPRLEPVPTGLPGALWIGGDGVARGYLGDPAATAERFLPDPFSATPGGRLFRTGDVARWRADGQLEFVGRADDQIKIRGFRVEPGEVESALLAHPNVREAVVVAREDASGDCRLAAYVVARAEAADAATDIRRFLKERLPRPMIPASLTILDALPLTLSGKVDRARLPEPARSEPGREANAAAPRDPIEARLVALWEEVLDVRPVGIDENFFDLGGHSLLAIRLMMRIEQEFGRKLPLSALLVGATVEDLAPSLRELATETPWTPLVPLLRSGSKPPLFCVHPAGGIVYCFHELARQLGEDRPFYAFQAAGLEDGQKPETSLDAMAARYVAAMRAVQPKGPYHLAGWSLGGIVAYAMACQLRDAGEDVATVALFDTRAPRSGGLVAEMEPERLAELEALGREIAALGLRHESEDQNGSAGGLLEDAAVLAEFAADMALGFGGDPRRLFAHLAQLPPDERQAHVLKHFGLDQVYHLETGPERVRRLWSVLRANFLAAARYVPPTYPGRLTLFRASGWDAGGLIDPTMGWNRLADAGVAIHAVPGDHATILKSPGVTVLAEALRATLDANEEASR
jgi:thioesterase domain-containing protein/acyl carrier protein